MPTQGGVQRWQEISRTAGFAAAGVATGPWVLRAHAQAQTIKIGILYDHPGPFSAAG